MSTIHQPSLLAALVVTALAPPRPGRRHRPRQGPDDPAGSQGAGRQGAAQARGPAKPAATAKAAPAADG